MSRGLDLLSATILEGGHSGIAKLKRELFLEEELPAFEFLREFYVRYGVLPSLEVCSQNGIILPDLSGHSVSYRYHYEETLNRAKYNISTEFVGEYQTTLRDRNLDRAEELVHELIQDFNRFSSTRGTYDAQDFMELARDSYDLNYDMRVNGVSNAILSGWEPLDSLIHGYRGGDLIVFAGRRGAGKSYILARQAWRAMVMRRRVLYATMEMRALSTANRFAAIALGINPDDILIANLSEENRNRLNTTVENFDQYPFRIVEGSFDKTVTNIVAEAKEFRPDIMFIDGSYLVKPDSARYTQRWETQAVVHEEIKTRIALECDIPVVCSVQQNRASKGIKDGDGIVAGSDVIEQLASVLVSVAKMSRNEQRRLLKLVKNRDGEEGLFVINFIFRNMDMTVNEEDTRLQREIIRGGQNNREQEERMNEMGGEM